MKKTLFIFSLAALVLVGCNKNAGEDNTVKPLDATVEFAEASLSLVYGEPVTVAATVVTEAALEKASLQAVKKVDETTYEAVGEVQTYAPEGLELALEFFADSQEATDIELILFAGEQQSVPAYLPVTVTGEPKGTAWINDAVVLYADNKVPHNVNDPVTYPVENTGAGSDTKSFFSMHGVKVGDKVEHILSLNDLLAVGGQNASMCWLNCLEKTDAAPKEDGSLTYIGGQRGYMFSGCRKASLGGGTTGRQCDIQNYNGQQILDENIDYDFTFIPVCGSWIGEKYDEAKYKLVDRIWLSAGESTETNLGQIKTFWALKQIQENFDNATLGVEEEPTALGGKTYLRRYTNAGQTASSAPTEGFRAGDYIIIRSEKKEGEGEAAVSTYYYGLVQVLQLFDDSSYFTLDSTKGEWKVLDIEGAYDFFMKPAYFAVKTQCEILK
ncbi:MAG: hypothetical protein ACI3ZF_05850 [Candidatus Cryptobacteroides sp.]